MKYIDTEANQEIDKLINENEDCDMTIFGKVLVTCAYTCHLYMNFLFRESLV